jgi:hypothetical protein
MLMWPAFGKFVSQYRDVNYALHLRMSRITIIMYLASQEFRVVPVKLV